MHSHEIVIPRWNSDLPLFERRLQLEEDLDSWIHSESLRALIDAWGSNIPKTASLAAQFQWLDAFSAEHWDFRRGQERNLAQTPPFSQVQISATTQAAEAFGMTETRAPLRMEYDYFLILGGLVQACVTRSQYAADLKAKGIRASTILALGGFRTVSHDENVAAAKLGIEATDEFQALLNGMKNAFQINQEAIFEGSSGSTGSTSDWSIANFTIPQAISVIAAPSSKPHIRRANTSDTFAWWAQRVDDLHGKHLLLITSSIYVPYQNATAIKELGLKFDVSIDTVGTSPTESELNDQTRVFAPAQYLQEIRSAIRGYQSLYKSLLQSHGA